LTLIFVHRYEFFIIKHLITKILKIVFQRTRYNINFEFAVALNLLVVIVFNDNH